MEQNLHDTLRQMLVDDLFVEMAPAQIGLDDGLRTVVGLDSVGFVEVRVLCERRFGVQIGDEDYTPDNFSSVRRLASLIERLQSARNAAARKQG
jgi:acyl carrier protein